MFLSDGPHGIRKQAAAADHFGLNESISVTFSLQLQPLQIVE
ncbi:hypothetical protein [Caldibacillus thermoamylovorans]|jgi:beta-glucosidase|nr:hypothetical protein [Caldibacillus thermoamylovorans]